MLYKKKWPLLIFLVPGLLFMMVFLYVPFLENIKNSFYNMTAVVKMPGTDWKFIGWENYKRMFTDPDVRTALLNSVKMMVLTVIFEVGIAFVLAVLVSQIKRLQQLFRTVYFFPVVISATAIGLMFKLFYNYNGGMLNQIFRRGSSELAVAGAGLSHGVHSHPLELHRILLCNSAHRAQRHSR